MFFEILYIVEGGPLTNVFLGDSTGANRARYLCFWSFIRILGGPFINEFLRVYFDVYRQSPRFNFPPSKQSSFYVFRVFGHSKGGNPARYLCFCCFYRHYGGNQEIFLNEKLYCSIPGNIFELGALLL